MKKELERPKYPGFINPFLPLTEEQKEYLRKEREYEKQVQFEIAKSLYGEQRALDEAISSDINPWNLLP